MGIDAKLYISTRFSLDDILNVMRSLPDVKEVTTESTHTPAMLIIAVRFSRNVGKWSDGSPIDRREIYFHFGERMLMSMRANDHATEFFTQIAERIGGELMREDCTDLFEPFYGMLYEESGLSYFLKYAVIHGYMANEYDLAGLIRAINEWTAKYRSVNKEIVMAAAIREAKKGLK